MKWTSQRPIGHVKHVLISNDFPPKVGGIQNYLFEIYRRLPNEKVCVITSSYSGDSEFDKDLPFTVVRLNRTTLLPTPALVREIKELLAIMNPTTIAIAPLLPLGLIASRLSHRVTFLIWGAEVAIPASLPLLRRAVRYVLKDASGIVAGGQYVLDVLDELGLKKNYSSMVVHPGVDTQRFYPPSTQTRAELRKDLGLGRDDFMLLGVSRLVRRKGMNTLIEVAALVQNELPGIKLVIAGNGRRRHSLERLARRLNVDVDFRGGVSDRDLVGLYQSADVFAMLCRNRWWGLEQEGFGIVFLEAGASGVVALAGDSGGASEAVEDGVTGFVIKNPKDASSAARRILQLVRDSNQKSEIGLRARERVCSNFDYDVLARKFGEFFNLYQ